MVVGHEWVEETLRLVPFAEWDRFTTGEWGEDSPYVTVYGWLPRDQDGYKDFVLLILWPKTETVYFTTSSAERTEDIFEALYDEPLEEHNECQRVEDTFDVDNAIRLVTDGGEDVENFPQREIRLEVKKTYRGKLLTFADSAAPGGARGMTDAEMKANDYIGKLTSRFDTDRVDPGVVGCVKLEGDDIVGVDWCSDEARAAAGGEN